MLQPLSWSEQGCIALFRSFLTVYLSQWNLFFSLSVLFFLFLYYHPPFPYYSHAHTFSSHTRQLIHGLCFGGVEWDREEEHPAEQSQQYGCSVRERGQHVEGTDNTSLFNISMYKINESPGVLREYGDAHTRTYVIIDMHINIDVHILVCV